MPRNVTKQTLVDQLAELALPSKAPDFEAVLEDSPVYRIWQKLLRRHRQPYKVTSARRREAEYERISNALPEDMRKTFSDFENGAMLSECATREAAYLVGVAVGRRLAGGVR